MPKAMTDSAQRRSARKAKPTSRQISNLEAVITSPSRPAKRRKANAANIKPALKEDFQEAQDNMEDDDAFSDASGTMDYIEPAERIIPYLLEADYSVVVAFEHPNTDGDNSVSAFAKIAGKTWTYYVKTPSINIGRSPDSSSKQLLNPAAAASNEFAHIDLGPSKLVSRVHARLYYNQDEEKWQILCEGRNGVRVNNLLVKKAQQVNLHSGDVIEIGGTEMIFMSPDVQAVIHERYLERMNISNIAEVQPRSGPIHAHPQATSEQYSGPVHITPYGPPQGQVPLPTTASYARPTTPIKSLMQAPYLAQSAVATPQYDRMSTQAASQGPGQSVMMDTSEQLDYSSDATKHIKPPLSYANLIAQCVLSTKEEKASLNSIYEFIRANYAYYRHIEHGWQNSIRHNLSLNSSFYKVPREPHEPGKGGMWRITADKKAEVQRNGLKLSTRGGARPASNPTSPAPKRSPKRKTSEEELGDGMHVVKTSPAIDTPTRNSYATTQEAHTPSRDPRGPVQASIGTQPLPQFSDDASPLAARAPYLSQNAAAAGSPPTLSSSAYFNDEHNTGYSFYTPAPQRHEPRLLPPSTAKLPSQFLPQSSPAPFWRLGDNMGSTPARLPDTSPMKPVNQPGPAPFQSSSPPPGIANGSPIRARPTPPEPRQMHSTQINQEDDEDGQLDLMGQFPKIGDRMVSSAAH